MDLLQTGNIIYASETSEESGKSHSAGSVIRVADATVDVTAGVTLIKPEHFARQQIFIIKNGKMQIPFNKLNGIYTVPDPTYGDSDIKMAYEGYPSRTIIQEEVNKNNEKTCVFNIIGASGLTYIGGYYTNSINISKIKSVEITYMTTNLSNFDDGSSPQYRFALVKLSNLNEGIHGYYNESNEPSEGQFYYAGYDDNPGFYRHPTFGTQLLGRYPKDNVYPHWTEANGDFNSSFETISFNLDSSINDEYNCIIAGNCFTDDFKLYIKNFVLNY